jgi:hypothetical protein
MTRNEATKLLDFWYDRQKNCQDVIFEFCGWWSKADKEVKPPVGWVREFAVMSTQTQKMAGKQTTRASTRGKSNSRAVAQSTGSDDEDDRVQSRKIMKAATQTANGDRNAGKKHQMSTSRVVSEAPDALIHRSSLSEGTLGDDMPVTGMRKAQMNMKKRIDRKSRNGRGEHLQTLSRATHPDVDDDGITEQSVSQAPDATADQRRKVGPASRPAGKLRAQRGERSSLDEAPNSEQNPGGRIKQGSKHSSNVHPEERPRVESHKRTRLAEDVLDDSPTKRTRSHATDVPQKRAKKPNSRYTNNFVRY